MVPLLLGGIGLFLLGMTLLTDGLKALAGDALRRVLSRFTGGPTRAVLSGAALTALVQSSSATTLTTIGFVSAGLLTFPQALGVVLGANLGTTSTAWIVSLLGLKLSVSTLALPLVGIGALARILARDRWAAAGTALAGFGLVFIGIDTLQAGMADLADRIDPASLPGATLAGRLALVAIGGGMTVVMQSSSAAVATTLAAVHAGTVSLEQAGALVIGQNIGTTVTAGIAAIGASVAARRTAIAHVLFNVLTGTMALAILPLFVALVARGAGSDDPAIVLALFHTAFNLLGIALFLPLLDRFAALVTRLVAERGPALTGRLDPTVTKVAAVAVEAARRTLVDVATTLLDAARELLTPAAGRPRRDDRAPLEAAAAALEATRRFLGRLRTESESAAVYTRHLAALHAIDHLEQLVATVRDPLARSALGRAELATVAELAEAGRTLAAVLPESAAALAASARAVEPAVEVATGALEQVASELAARRRAGRAITLERTARGEIAPEVASARLELMRWIDRVGYHAWRVAVHLAPQPREPAAPPPVDPA
jgi:phosphate:Na+ symporter